LERLFLLLLLIERERFLLVDRFLTNLVWRKKGKFHANIMLMCVLVGEMC
jgi:hypothetical protein